MEEKQKKKRRVRIKGTKQHATARADNRGVSADIDPKKREAIKSLLLPNLNQRVYKEVIDSYLAPSGRKKLNLREFENLTGLDIKMPKKKARRIRMRHNSMMPVGTKETPIDDGVPIDQLGEASVTPPDKRMNNSSAMDEIDD